MEDKDEENQQQQQQQNFPGVSSAPFQISNSELRCREGMIGNLLTSGGVVRDEGDISGNNSNNT